MKQIPVILLGVYLVLHSFPLTAQEAYPADSLITFTQNTTATSLDADGQKLKVLSNGNSHFNAFTTHPLNTFDHWAPSGEFHPRGNNVLSLTHPMNSLQKPIALGLKNDNKEFFLSNRRNRYSSLWGFASLNYIYADLVGLMDRNILAQYQKGEVNGTKITPGFLAAAAGFMQIPLSNVFLPQIIKNEKTLRWVQIASGTIMTLVQAGTLFVGKPSPHYIIFSAFEIGTTLYLTLDAIKWKPKKNNPVPE
jgi:hypothetical protein